MGTSKGEKQQTQTKMLGILRRLSGRRAEKSASQCRTADSTTSRTISHREILWTGSRTSFQLSQPKSGSLTSARRQSRPVDVDQWTKIIKETFEKGGSVECFFNASGNSEDDPLFGLPMSGPEFWFGFQPSCR